MSPTEALTLLSTPAALGGEYGNSPQVKEAVEVLRGALDERQKAYERVKDWAHRVEERLTIILAECDDCADGAPDATDKAAFANHLIGLSNDIMLGKVNQLTTLKARIVELEGELSAASDTLDVCVKQFTRTIATLEKDKLALVEALGESMEMNGRGANFLKHFYVGTESPSFIQIQNMVEDMRARHNLSHATLAAMTPNKEGKL